MCTINQNIKQRRNVRKPMPAPIVTGERWRAEQAREEARRKRVSFWQRLKEFVCK